MGYKESYELQGQNEFYDNLNRSEQPIKKSKKRMIWVGQIGSIFGYGLLVLETSEKACKEALEGKYNEWVDGRGDEDDYPTQYNEDGTEMTRFEKAMENWGGTVEEVEIGKVYYDGFRY
jgi:hypothetical protein